MVWCLVKQRDNLLYFNVDGITQNPTIKSYFTISSFGNLFSLKPFPHGRCKLILTLLHFVDGNSKETYHRSQIVPNLSCHLQYQ